MNRAGRLLGDDDEAAEISSPDAPSSLRDQLAAAGFDLSDHPLVGVFDSLSPVDTDTDTDTDCAVRESADNCSAAVDATDVDALPAAAEPDVADEVEPAGGRVPAASELRSGAGDRRSDADSAEAPDDAPLHPWVSRHPLLSDTAWADLAAFAPEVTNSITGLMDFKSELRSFDRPMGPDEALLLIDGAEALSRISEALFTLALSVCERVGPPPDSGAKDTKSLIQHRLSLTPYEARRRTDLAKNLGGRVDMTGQALAPLCPEVSEGLHSGALSAGQAKAIDDCLKDLPDWVSSEVRADVERRLVEHAPGVRVKDLRGIFDHMLGYIDPDGKEPRDETPRSDYSITMRPKRNGDWVLGGLLDPIAGAALNGLLTSRIKSAEQLAARSEGTGQGCERDAFGTPVDRDDSTGPGSTTGPGSSTTGSGSTTGSDEDGRTVDGSSAADGQKALFDVVDAVLRGDCLDAPLPDPGTAHCDSPLSACPDDASRQGEGDSRVRGEKSATECPVGVGVREDGALVDLTAERPSARAWIYERFATLISRISMEQAATGSPYALVVTAKAEDLANNTGEGTTGAETPVPIRELSANGLNGRVFFHLMTDTAQTVQVTTEKRFANKNQIAVVTARDRGCTFPGCDSPPGWCEVNHVVPWSEGGRTDINNLALACSAHHHLLDRSEWEMRMLADGRPSWVPPASVDPARRPILHPRFIAAEIVETLFDDRLR